MESSLRPMFILLAAMCVAKYTTDYSRIFIEVSSTNGLNLKNVIVYSL